MDSPEAEPAATKSFRPRNNDAGEVERGCQYRVTTLGPPGPQKVATLFRLAAPMEAILQLG
eukprot:855477-Pyramimonas_sp.AAC.1